MVISHIVFGIKLKSSSILARAWQISVNHTALLQWSWSCTTCTSYPTEANTNFSTLDGLVAGIHAADSDSGSCVYGSASLPLEDRVERRLCSLQSIPHAVTSFHERCLLTQHPHDYGSFIPHDSIHLSWDTWGSLSTSLQCPSVVISINMDSSAA